MRLRMISVLMAMSLSVGVFGQVAVPDAVGQNASRFAGVWRGQFDGLPGVDLVITDEGGQLRGAALFYLHFRPDVKSRYTSTPGLPEPMLDLKAEGQTLRFEVSHRHAHPPTTLNDPPVPFRLKLIGPGRAELVNENESDAPQLVLTRSDY